MDIIMSHVWGSAYTERALASIGSGHRIFLIDNSPMGEMQRYSIRNPNVRWLKTQTRTTQRRPIWTWEPKSCAESWNIGLRAATSEWVVNVNPDVHMAPKGVDRIKDEIGRAGDAILLVSTLGFNVWCAKRRAILDLGGFDDETFWPSGGEDEDMLVRIAQAGLKWKRIPLAAWHMDGGHIQRGDGYRNVETFRQKWGWPPQSPEYKAIVAQAVSR